MTDSGQIGRAALNRVMGGEDLSREEVEELFGLLMDGELEDPVKAGLLVGLAMKGETADELSGAARAMRARVIRVDHSCSNVLDTCGTGGDGRGTFNISTAAALVTAAAGVTVAKHGNRSVSSKSGSADVLAALGVEVDVGAEVASRALDEIGMAFLFAPRLHPAMREVMPVRRALGVRTLFNLVGPLTNPAGADRQLLGVYAADRVRIVAEVLADLGSRRALVVHGSDGLDEITLTGPTRVAEVRDGTVSSFEIGPEDFGFATVSAEKLRGGSPDDNARSMLGVLRGEPGPLLDVTLVNAAAGLVVAAAAESWKEGVARCRQAIDEGAAFAKLEALRRFDGQ